MSDIECVVLNSKKLEHLLETRMNATGRGLHEMTSSVSRQLDMATIKKLRFIASVRNGIVHDFGNDELKDREGFEAACAEVEQTLYTLTGGKPRRIPNRYAFWIAILTLAIIVTLGVNLL